MKNTAIIALALAAAAARASQTKEPVDWVNPQIGNISHMLVPTFPAVQLPNAMYRFTPPNRSYLTDTVDEIPLDVPAHRNQGVFRLRLGRGATGYDTVTVKPHLYEAYFDGWNATLRLAPARRGAVGEVVHEGGERLFEVTPKGKGSLERKGGVVSGHDLFNGTTKVWLWMELEESAEKTKFRFGVSYIDLEQARRNMPSGTLESVSAAARAEWNGKLSRIEVEGGTDDDKAVFYTALWRCYERMVDVTEDGRYYSPWDGRVHDADGVPFWTDDWVWDTYRAAHPLMCILEPEAEGEKLASYLRAGIQSGMMPTFPVPSGDMHHMNGRHYAAIFLDAMRKGVGGFDARTAYGAMKKSMLGDSMLPWRRQKRCELDDFYWKNGYFPALGAGEKETCADVHPHERRQSVAVTLAQSYDSWCLAEMAKDLGLEEDEEFFRRDSRNYEKLWRADTRFFHPKTADGGWVEPFDYKYSGGLGARDYYDENNGWTYRWDVQHDIAGLIGLFGGNAKFVEALDRTFSEPPGKPIWEFYAHVPDSTGLTGMFVMGNEPSFHVPYLYNRAGAPWKTQKRVRHLLRSWFRNDLMGIPGDEDGGGMSAFVVFSMMGFYPVTPGLPEYDLASPVFEEVRVRAPGGVFTIRAPGASDRMKYVRGTKLDGAVLNGTLLPHAAVARGATLEFDLSDRPCREPSGL